MRISIPKPCHEDWKEMTAELQGAFCKACSKTVIDFTLMSDAEIIAYLEKKDKEKTCGRFYVNQLAPYELKVDLREIPVRRNFSKIFVVTLFLIFSGLFVCKSDTGNLLSLKVNQAAADTSCLALVIDTLANQPLAEQSTVESVEPTVAVMGGISFPQEIIKKPDTTIIIKDTIVKPGEETLLGWVGCSKPVNTETKNNQPVLKEPRRPMIMGKMKIMGDIAY